MAETNKTNKTNKLDELMDKLEKEKEIPEELKKVNNVTPQKDSRSSKKEHTPNPDLIVKPEDGAAGVGK